MANPPTDRDAILAALDRLEALGAQHPLLAVTWQRTAPLLEAYRKAGAQESDTRKRRDPHDVEALAARIRDIPGKPRSLHFAMPYMRSQEIAEDLLAHGIGLLHPPAPAPVVLDEAAEKVAQAAVLQLWATNAHRVDLVRTAITTYLTEQAKGAK